MGFFKKIKKGFKSVTKTVAKVAPKAIVATATGGASLVVPGLNKTLQPLLAPTNLSQLANTARLVAAPATGGQSMAFNTNQFLGAVGGILSNSPINAFQTAGNLATLTQQFLPATTAKPITYNQPMQGQAMTVSNVPAKNPPITQEIWNILANKLLPRLGFTVPANMATFLSRAKKALGAIASLARKTPAGTMVSVLMGIGLTVYEANLLTGWYATKKKRKRINPANARALRRSVRRIRSFHRLCQHADVLGRPSRSRSYAYSAPRRGRCGTCRKSPCCC